MTNIMDFKLRNLDVGHLHHQLRRLSTILLIISSLQKVIDCQAANKISFYWDESSFDRITFFQNLSVVLTNCFLVEKLHSFKWIPRWSFLSNDILSNFFLIWKECYQKEKTVYLMKKNKIQKLFFQILNFDIVRG